MILLFINNLLVYLRKESFHLYRFLSMDYKIVLTVFATVFIAELGDKTQLATMLFAADKEVSKWMIFFGASLALIATSAIGVLAGSVISDYISEKNLHYIAGVGFILIGAWTLIKA
jgi:putative Ca2+/H+ antiporter (TMEM165/GDT1 family)